jgi:hypothetical protein
MFLWTFTLYYLAGSEDFLLAGASVTFSWLGGAVGVALLFSISGHSKVAEDVGWGTSAGSLCTRGESGICSSSVSRRLNSLYNR